MKILIVDDDPGCREMLFNYLNRNHELSVLTNGHSALALLADDSHDFDLVLLDLHMPRLRGEELMRVLAEWKNLNVRFVIMSGMPDIERIRALPSVLAVIPKPFKLAKLDEVLNGIINAA